jgi:hypothetical protein
VQWSAVQCSANKGENKKAGEARGKEGPCGCRIGLTRCKVEGVGRKAGRQGRQARTRASITGWPKWSMAGSHTCSIARSHRKPSSLRPIDHNQGR